MTNSEKARIRALAEQGFYVGQIARMAGRAENTITTALMRMGIFAKQRKSLIRSYRQPHLYDDELDALTEKQKQEREISEMKAFRLKTDDEMTYATAMKVMKQSDAELEADLKIDEKKIRIVRETAWRFLERVEEGSR